MIILKISHITVKKPHLDRFLSSAMSPYCYKLLAALGHEFEVIATIRKKCWHG